jgi:hypothetical protein
MGGCGDGRIFLLSPDAQAAHHGRNFFQQNRGDPLRVLPEASAYAAIMNLTKRWPTPAIWLEARLARKKSEEDNGQTSFNFQKTKAPVLRAIHTVTNAGARDRGMMRFPIFACRLNR